MACFVIATILLYAFWWLLSFVIPNQVYWRQWGFGFWTRTFVRIAGMRIEVVGTPPRSPFFLVSNHLSYVDIAALRATVPGVFVAKKEIESWFLAGPMVRDMGNIFIDRTKRRDIPRAGKEILQRLDNGEGVIIFPEGTSTKGEEVLPFNSSFFEFAANADLPVSYVSVGYRTPDGNMSPAKQCAGGMTQHFSPTCSVFLPFRILPRFLTSVPSPYLATTGRCLRRCFTTK